MTPAIQHVNTYFSRATAHKEDITYNELSAKEIEQLDLLFPLLIHAKSGRQRLAYALLNIICSRDTKYNNCKTKQVTFAKEVFSFGYETDKKVSHSAGRQTLTDRQIRRVLTDLKDAGLIVWERSGKRRTSVNLTESTQLGRDLYWLVIRKNNGPIRIKLSTLVVDNPVDKPVLDEKMSGQNEKMSGRDPNEYVGSRKNVRTNTLRLNNKNNIRAISDCSIIDHSSFYFTEREDDRTLSEDENKILYALILSSTCPLREKPKVDKEVLRMIEISGRRHIPIENFKRLAEKAVEMVEFQLFVETRNIYN